MLINKRESIGSKIWNDSNDFIEYLYDMDDIYKNIERYNPNKNGKILIILDDMVADTLTNDKFNPIVNELFIPVRKQSYAILVCFIKKG